MLALAFDYVIGGLLWIAVLAALATMVYTVIASVARLAMAVTAAVEFRLERG